MVLDTSQHRRFHGNTGCAVTFRSHRCGWGTRISVRSGSSRASWPSPWRPAGRWKVSPGTMALEASRRVAYHAHNSLLGPNDSCAASGCRFPGLVLGWRGQRIVYRHCLRYAPALKIEAVGLGRALRSGESGFFRGWRRGGKSIGQQESEHCERSAGTTGNGQWSPDRLK